MCRAVTCRVCGKVSWAGCGQHVERVLADVAPEDRCRGDHAAPASESGGSMFKRLFGRG
jgi:hypothetical protein